MRLLLTAAPELLAPLLARRPRSRLVPEEVPVRDAVELVDLRRAAEVVRADLVAALAELSVAPVPERVRVALSLMVRPSPVRSTSRRLSAVQPCPWESEPVVVLSRTRPLPVRVTVPLVSDDQLVPLGRVPSRSARNSAPSSVRVAEPDPVIVPVSPLRFVRLPSVSQETPSSVFVTVVSEERDEVVPSALVRVVSLETVAVPSPFRVTSFSRSAVHEPPLEFVPVVVPVVTCPSSVRVRVAVVSAS